MNTSPESVLIRVNTCSNPVLIQVCEQCVNVHTQTLNQAQRETTHNATKAQQLQEQVQVQAKQNEELSEKVNNMQLQMRELLQAKKVDAAETPEPGPKRARRS